MFIGGIEPLIYDFEYIEYKKKQKYRIHIAWHILRESTVFLRLQEKCAIKFPRISRCDDKQIIEHFSYHSPGLLFVLR